MDPEPAGKVGQRCPDFATLVFGSGKMIYRRRKYDGFAIKNCINMTDKKMTL